MSDTVHGSEHARDEVSGTAGLPAVEIWWPALSIEGKHDLQRDLTAPLSEAVLQEIASIAGSEALVDDRLVLSMRDRDFIQTQGEATD